MAKVSIEATCFCDFSDKIIFKKPDHFTPTLVVHNCTACGSRVAWTFAKRPGKNMVSKNKKLIDCSATLRSLMEEDPDVFAHYVDTEQGQDLQK